MEKAFNFPAQKSQSVLAPPDGIDPQRWYDSTQFCDRMDIANKRRYRLLAELRHCKEAIPNGHSFAAQGAVLLKLWRLVEKGDALPANAFVLPGGSRE